MNKDEMTTKLSELLEDERVLYWELNGLAAGLEKYSENLSSFVKDIQEFVNEVEEIVEPEAWDDYEQR